MMMRRVLWAAVLGLLGAVACTEDETDLNASIGLDEVGDIERVGPLMFVASAGGSELRVIDTLADPSVGRPKNPGYLRAPNPLEVLSIPVVQRPVELASDVRYRPATALPAGTAEPFPGVLGDDCSDEEVDEGTCTEERRSHGARYVFVRGTGASALSVVGAQRQAGETRTEREALLRNLGTVQVPDSRPITAFTAIGPPADAAGDAEPSYLFLSTQDVAGTAHLYVAVLPPPRALAGLAQEERNKALTPVEITLGGLPVLTGAAVQALLVLPQSRVAPPAPGAQPLRLAFASRSPTGTFAAGVFDVTVTKASDAETPTATFASATPLPLQFRSPVRMLRTHPRIKTDPQSIVSGRLLPAGTRIFGVLDESACTSAQECGGVEAVNGLPFVPTDAPIPNPALPDVIQGTPQAPVAQPPLAAGAIALDVTGQPMLPVRVSGGALVQDFTVGRDLSSRNKPAESGTGRTVFQDWAGVITASDGAIYLFDPVELRHILPPDAAGRVEPLSLTFIKADGGVAGTADLTPNPDGGVYGPDGKELPNNGRVAIDNLASVRGTLTTATLTPGMARQEVFTLTVGGPLPGLEGVPLTGGGPLELPEALAGRVDVADTVRSATPACDAVQRVAAKGAPAGGRVTLTLDAPLPACATSVAILAGLPAEGGTRPWVLTGSESGYLGRTDDSDPTALATDPAGAQVPFPRALRVRSEPVPAFHRSDAWLPAAVGGPVVPPPLLTFDLLLWNFPYAELRGGSFRFLPSAGTLFQPTVFRTSPLSQEAQEAGYGDVYFLPFGVAAVAKGQGDTANAGPFLYITYPSGDRVARFFSNEANTLPKSFFSFQ
jgi:hypothetical protein